MGQTGQANLDCRLRRWVKEVFLIVDADGKSKMVCCKKHCLSASPDDREVAMFYLEYLKGKNFISFEEFLKIKMEVEKMTLVFD